MKPTNKQINRIAAKALGWIYVKPTLSDPTGEGHWEDPNPDTMRSTVWPEDDFCTNYNLLPVLIDLLYTSPVENAWDAFAAHMLSNYVGDIDCTAVFQCAYEKPMNYIVEYVLKACCLWPNVKPDNNTLNRKMAEYLGYRAYKWSEIDTNAWYLLDPRNQPVSSIGRSEAWLEDVPDFCGDKNLSEMILISVNNARLKSEFLYQIRMLTQTNDRDEWALMLCDAKTIVLAALSVFDLWEDDWTFDWNDEPQAEIDLDEWDDEPEVLINVKELDNAIKPAVEIDLGDDFTLI